MSVIQAVKRTMQLAAIGVALVASSPTAYSQQPTAAAIASAKELVTITGATTLFNPLIAGVVEQAKLLFLQQNPTQSKELNEIAAKIRADLQPRFVELSNEVAKIYATHFSEQELKDLLAFYKTPAGKKLIIEQPKVADESLKFAQTWANTLSDQVIGMMRQELKKRGLGP